MPRKTSPDNITELKFGQVFVFGSNLSGRHGAGAALLAAEEFGARYGVGVGPTGRCYAIPTKDRSLKVLPLDQIAEHVANFLRYARRYPELEFLVTQIGCGLAGYKPHQIAPLFADAPDNVLLPSSFEEYYNL